MMERDKRDPPIRGFFRGYWIFFTFGLSRRGKDPGGYQALLDRMDMSEVGAAFYRVAGAVGTFSLTLAFVFRYDNWFSARGIHLATRRDGFGYLCTMALFWICHAVACYFLGLIWYLGLGDDPDPSASSDPDQSSRSR